MAKFISPKAEGDEYGPDANGDYWIEDAYGGLVKKGDPADPNDRTEYNTSNLPMTGLGRAGVDIPDDGVSKPGGNIIPEAVELRFQANFNRWAVTSLDALDDALPIQKIDGDLPDAGDYDGDMILKDEILHIWSDGAWVQVSSESGSSVHVGPLPPEDSGKPDPEIGDLWFEDTTDLQLYIYLDLPSGPSWVVASPPASLEGVQVNAAAIDELTAAVARIDYTTADLQSGLINTASRTNEALNEINESLGKVTLQEVLDNNNVADSGFVLTNKENDAILVSPEQGRIMAGAVGDVVPKVELRHVTDDGFLDTSIVALELDEDGKRFDIECEERVDNIHFRFGNDDKLIINKKGDAQFTGKVEVEPGTHGKEVITFEQLANLAGEIDEIKEEKEKGPWKAELPSTGSEGGREVLVDAPGFPEVQGGSNMMILNESGGADGFGQLGILIDPNNQDDENKALQRWLKAAAAECLADADSFRDKYSFYCHQAEEKGFAVRNQPIHSIEDPGMTTFKINFYGKPNVAAKQDDVVGVEFFEEAAEGHRPATGKFFMEVYQDTTAQEQACAEAYTKCLEDAGDDQIAASNCLRDWDACKGAARDGFVPTADFGKATALVFNRTDASSLGVTHSFDEVRIGDSINVTDSKTGHFILAEIDAIQQQGDHIRFTVDTLSSSGAIIDGNKCDVEFFNFSFAPEAPDLDNYVQKTGDTMTGSLKLKNSEEEAELITRFVNSGEKSKLYLKYNNDSRLVIADDIIEAARPIKLKQEGTSGSYAVNRNTVAAPARMGWKYTDDGTPEKYEVFYKPTALKVSFTPFIGDRLYYHEEDTKSWELTPNTYFSMWEYDKAGKGWVIRRTGHVTKIAIHGSGFWMDHDEMGTWGDLKIGKLYYITVGGFIS